MRQRTASLHCVETERGFMAAVIEYARLCGWLCYHTHDSRRSAAGYPDLCMVRDRRIVYAELKVGRGRLTAAQSAWIAALTKAAAEVYVWRPADWPDIERILAREG